MLYTVAIECTFWYLFCKIFCLGVWGLLWGINLHFLIPIVLVAFTVCNKELPLFSLQGDKTKRYTHKASLIDP